MIEPIGASRHVQIWQSILLTKVEKEFLQIYFIVLCLVYLSIYKVFSVYFL